MKHRDRATRTSREVPYANYNPSSNDKAEEDACVFTFNTKLVKPTASIGSLTKGDILNIGLDDKENVLAKDKSGSICGYITTPGYQRKIILCIKKGRDYEAEVIKIGITGCEVNVYGGR